MAEKSFEGYLRRGLKRRAHCVKHVDVSPGIADLSLYFAPRGGKTVWVELKDVPRWPVKPETRVVLSEFSEHQALFLRMRRGWLFVRAPRTYMLFHATEAWAIWAEGGFPRAEMERRAMKVWYGAVVWSEFEEIVT